MKPEADTEMIEKNLHRDWKWNDLKKKMEV